MAKVSFLASGGDRIDDVDDLDDVYDNNLFFR
jgi:hypothetical protein